MKSSIKFAFGALALAAAASASAGISLTLTSYEANATLTVSVAAGGSSKAAGVVLKEMGTTARLADLNGTNAAGRPTTQQVFAFPATKADITLATSGAGGLPVKTNSGASVGAALRASTPDIGGDMGLANFNIDFNKHIVYADILDKVAKTTKKNVELYTFTDIVPAKTVLKGLSLNVHAEIGTLVFTTAAADQLQTGLGLDPVLSDALRTVDWGTIVVEVNSKTRAKKINATAFTLAGMK